MSGKKISEMTAITGAQLDQTNDVLPVLDVSDTTNPNKKISIQELASVIGASGTTNVDLSLDGSNNLTLTDSDSNTVTVDLSSLDNSSLTLADVTANGAVTTSSANFAENTDSTHSLGRLKVSNPFTNYMGIGHADLFGGNDIALYQSSAGGTVINSSSGQATTFRIAGTPILHAYSNGIVLGSGFFTSPAVTLDIQGTDAVQLTTGTTAQRPVTAANGMIRYNSDDDVFEGYNGDWGSVALFDSDGFIKRGNKIAYIKLNDTSIVTGEAGAFLGYSNSFIRNTGSAIIYDINGTVSRLTSNGFSINKSTPSVTLDIQGTDAVQLTSGTTAERPTAAAGMIRFNSTTSKFEGYDGTSWIDLN